MNARNGEGFRLHEELKEQHRDWLEEDLLEEHETDRTADLDAIRDRDARGGLEIPW